MYKRVIERSNKQFLTAGEPFQEHLINLFFKSENHATIKGRTEWAPKFHPLEGKGLTGQLFFFITFPKIPRNTQTVFLHFLHFLILGVCEKFNLSFNRSWNRTIEGQKKATIPNMAVGFYPGVKFEDILDDYKNLCFATIFGIQKANRKRIPVEKNTCTII